MINGDGAIDLDALKESAEAVIDEVAEELLDLSHRIHARPELAFEEHAAHDALTDILERSGLEVTRHAHDMPTAFAGRAGKGGPTIAVLSEYDALPGIGHACGHNIIGVSAVGAAIAAAAVADRAGGRILVLGTPGEEGGGGKVLLARAGAFDGVDAALMVHPSGVDLDRFDAIAIQQVSATYTGRAAHAAAAPAQGRNALDAAVLGYMGVASLRQHIASGERVHGIFTDGGAAPNVVPETAETLWYVRSPSVAGLHALKERVAACLRAGAEAAGCEVELSWKDPAYADMVDNLPMLERYRRNAERVGRKVFEATPDRAVIGSTDMGNVSHLVPSIHPMIASAPEGTTIHTTDFARHAVDPGGDRAVIDGAKIMASTVIDLWAEPGLMEAVAADFGAARESGRATGSADV